MRARARDERRPARRNEALEPVTGGGCHHHVHALVLAARGSAVEQCGDAARATASTRDERLTAFECDCKAASTAGTAAAGTEE